MFRGFSRSASSGMYKTHFSGSLIALAEKASQGPRKPLGFVGFRGVLRVIPNKLKVHIPRK